jgi:hypothetical protein
MFQVWGRKGVYTEFWWGNLRQSNHLKDPGVARRIILRWIFKKWNGGTDWIDLNQNRDRWQALVNMAMNLLTR